MRLTARAMMFAASCLAAAALGINVSGGAPAAAQTGPRR